jgi:hypothetical protein
MGRCRAERAESRQYARSGPPSRLLLQKTAVLLSATVPATRPHAVRLPRAAVCDTNRQKRPIGVLPTNCDAVRLLAAAAHGDREDRRGREKAKQGRGNACKPLNTVPTGISFGHVACLRRAVPAGNSVIVSVCSQPNL